MFLFNIPTHWPLGQEPPKAFLFRVYAALALNSTLFYSEDIAQGLGYATTLHKVQGPTLRHMTLWLDLANINIPAVGYENQ